MTTMMTMIITVLRRLGLLSDAVAFNRRQPSFSGSRFLTVERCLRSRQNVTTAPSLTDFRKRLKTHLFSLPFRISPVVPAHVISDTIIDLLIFLFTAC